VHQIVETDDFPASWQIDDVSVEAASAVPEPFTLSLIGLGLLGLDEASSAVVALACRL
jgi:hypothetical protein